MAHKKARSRKPWKARYEGYQINNSFSKNRRKKIERHLKDHPEDAQAQKALNVVVLYKRKPSAAAIGISSAEKVYKQTAAKIKRGMNAILYGQKKFPSDPSNSEARFMAITRTVEWPANLRKKYNVKIDKLDVGIAA